MTKKDLVIAPSSTESTTIKVKVNDRKQCPLEQFNNSTVTAAALPVRQRQRPERSPTDA
ncbi:hypothetical protein BJY01DRAFT_256594 [Aspergillus pseudoustus]|uniref:Uncharacterized protein n=1 Tax=Aspergillus pseudoustus TaxID=1810923 RepID=A0ABR4I9L2_9EURO